MLSYLFRLQTVHTCRLVRNTFTAPCILRKLAESWTKPEITDSELALDRYRLFRKDRANQKSVGHGAGGVLLYVKSNINAVERWDMSNETFKESIWCEIQINRSKILVGVCYRVPDATDEADQGTCKLLELANKETSVIMGDFNYHIDWENAMRMEKKTGISRIWKVE